MCTAHKSTYRERPDLFAFDLWRTIVATLAKHAFEVLCGPLQGVRIPEELVLDVLYQHRLASLAELLLKFSALHPKRARANRQS